MSDFPMPEEGGKIVRQDSPAFVKPYNTWIIINVGGGSTIDKPNVTMAPPSDPNTAGITMNFRVADVHAMYNQITERGGEFLTPRKIWGQNCAAICATPTAI